MYQVLALGPDVGGFAGTRKAGHVLGACASGGTERSRLVRIVNFGSLGFD